MVNFIVFFFKPSIASHCLHQQRELGQLSSSKMGLKVVKKLLCGPLNKMYFVTYPVFKVMSFHAQEKSFAVDLKKKK